MELWWGGGRIVGRFSLRGFDQSLGTNTRLYETQNPHILDTAPFTLSYALRKREKNPLPTCSNMYSANVY